MRKLRTLTINPSKNREVILAEMNGKKVVVKQPIGTVSPSEINIFLGEAEILTKVQECPGIIRLMNPPGNIPMIIYEYAPKTLREIIPSLGPDRASEIIRQIVDAIECIHNRGIIHGDLNPDNILIGEDGKIRIIDFESSARRNLGQRTFTPKYAAPEQISSEYGEISEKTDIFQLGAIIYEIYEGRTAFTEEWYNEITQGKHRLFQKTPPQIREIIDMCLEPDPEDRPTIKQLKRMLKIAMTAQLAITIDMKKPPIERVREYIEKIIDKPIAIGIEKLAQQLGLTPQQINAAINILTAEYPIVIIEQRIVTPKALIRIATKTQKPLAEMLAGKMLPTTYWQAILKQIEDMGTVVPFGDPLETRAAEKTEKIKANVDIIAGYAVPKTTQQTIRKYLQNRTITQQLIQQTATALNIPPQIIQPTTNPPPTTIFEHEHGDAVLSVAFSPDGRLLATGSYDKMLRVFEVGSWRTIQEHRHGGVVLSVAFSPDGRLLATGSSDKMLRVFSAVFLGVIRGFI